MILAGRVIAAKKQVDKCENIRIHDVTRIL